MYLRIFAIALLPAFAAWGDESPGWPVSGPMPDQPIAVREQSYVPVNAGAKRYEPVEPMPWGAVNRRVAPKQPQSKSNSQGHDAH
ncbi:hypothetical protein [Hyphomicrobium sp.]|uniref:hypothetical protein n=1 Tax=Hyphomicrobium sp. TaxID=82 RepID=UPI002B604123|nr:hypothetical protein [Hyphomicrobium sp.]HVZ04102.1 hypothetical protein [Hyphomicrobium sp.]